MNSEDHKKSQPVKEYNIKNYKINKTIGKGTFGKVKIGVHVPTGEKVSYKEIIDCNKNTREK